MDIKRVDQCWSGYANIMQPSGTHVIISREGERAKDEKSKRGKSRKGRFTLCVPFRKLSW